MDKESKILIADDDNLVREAVVKILEMFGYKVVSCASGEAAIDALRSRSAAADSDANLAAAHLNLGLLLSNAARFSEAITHFERVLDLDENNAQAKAALETARNAKR